MSEGTSRNEAVPTLDCDFCLENFSSRSERKEHILTHFLTKLCLGCEFQLVRIADDWYTAHNEHLCTETHPNESATADTEVKFFHVQIKPEENTFLLDDECNDVNESNDSNVDECSSSDSGKNALARDEDSLSANALVNLEFEVVQSEDEIRSDVFNRGIQEQTRPSGDTDQTVQCELCAKTMKRQSLGPHLRYVHKKFKRKHPKREKRTPEKTNSGRTMSSVTNLSIHMNTHLENARANLESDVVSSEDEPRSDTLNRGIEEQKRPIDHTHPTVQCELCAKAMKRQSLGHHMRYIHKIPVRKRPKPEKKAREKAMCTICGRIMSSTSNLSIHMNTHLDTKPFKCDICGSRFIQLIHLKEHLNVHGGKRPYECKFCPKAFARQSHLRAHTRTHTGEKPYKCNIDQCERAYTYGIDLNRHKYSAHGIYQKRHPCTICEKIYPENKLLTKHMSSAHPTLERN